MVVDIINDQQPFHNHHSSFPHHQHRTNTKYVATNPATTAVLSNGHHQNHRLMSDSHSLGNKAQKILGPPNAAFKQNSDFNDYPQTTRVIIESSNAVTTRNSQLSLAVNSTSPVNVNIPNIPISSSEPYVSLMSTTADSGLIPSSNTIEKRVHTVEQLVPLILKLVEQPKRLPENISNTMHRSKCAKHYHCHKNGDLQLSEPSDEEIEDTITVKPPNLLLSDHNRLSNTDDESENDDDNAKSNRIDESQQKQTKFSSIIHRSLSRDDSDKHDSDLQHSDIENEEDHTRQSDFSLSFFIEKKMDNGHQSHIDEDENHNTDPIVPLEFSSSAIINEYKDEESINEPRPFFSGNSTGFLTTSNDPVTTVDEPITNLPSPSNLFALPLPSTSSITVKTENSKLDIAPMDQLSTFDEEDINNYTDKKLNEKQVDNHHSDYSDPDVSYITEQVNLPPPDDTVDNININNNTNNNPLHDLEISSSDDDEHKTVPTKHRTENKHAKQRRRSTLLSPPSSSSSSSSSSTSSSSSSSSSSSCSPSSSPILIQKLNEQNIIQSVDNNKNQTKTSPNIKQETPPPSVVSSKDSSTKRLKINQKLIDTPTDIEKPKVQKQYTIERYNSDKVVESSNVSLDSSVNSCLKIKNDNDSVVVGDYKEKLSPTQEHQQQKLLNYKLCPISVAKTNDIKLQAPSTSTSDLSCNLTVVSPTHRKMKRLKDNTMISINKSSRNPKSREHLNELLLDTFCNQLPVNTKIDSKHPVLSISIPLSLFNENTKMNGIRDDKIYNNQKSNSTKRYSDGMNKTVGQIHLEENEVNGNGKITNEFVLNKRAKTSHCITLHDNNNKLQANSEYNTFKNTNEMEKNCLTNDVDVKTNVTSSINIDKSYLTNSHSSSDKLRTRTVSIECDLSSKDKCINTKTTETQTTENWRSSKQQQDQQTTISDMANKANYIKLKNMQSVELDSLARQKKKSADAAKRLTPEQMMLYSESVCYFILCAVGEKNIERRSGLLKETLNMLIQFFNRNKRFTPTSSCSVDPLLNVRPKFLLICYWLQSFLYHLCFNVNMTVLDRYVTNVNDFLTQVRSLDAKNNTTNTTTTSSSIRNTTAPTTASGIVQMTPGSDNPISPASNISTNSQTSSTNADAIPNMENNRSLIDYSKIMMYSYNSQACWNKIDRYTNDSRTLKEFVEQLQRQNSNRRLSRDDNPHDYIMYIFNAIELMRLNPA
ncbi:unnamed protein product [Didymodactylos carnosus]|uniref:Uncharacterized protein n=2 Tax=Didymodactylos carnosus TaxID=1234261 RepID=A0A814FKW0_9BILA|nr:unnamed protein product [Didymodactylos carnosus]CAF0987064.1 unnamed protein product [Didymodactylos carnosus]CAF3520450.1 unnamed protein product [Didymodactylos carnosus]CAF3759258.1 unnamed protein product [Didymodactylos carnosus]